MGSLKKKHMLIVIFDVLWFNQRNIVHKSIENHGPVQVANSGCVNHLFESETSVGNHLPQDQPHPITV